MKPIHFLGLLLLLMLSACHANDPVRKDSFDATGTWQQVGFNAPSDRYRIYFSDHTFVTLRCAPGDPNGTFLATGGGTFAIHGTTYVENGQKAPIHLTGDTLMTIGRGHSGTTWKLTQVFDASTLRLIKRETRDYSYTDATGHEVIRVFSINDIQMRAKRKTMTVSIVVLAVLALGATGYAIRSRRRRKRLERKLAQYETGRLQASDELKQALDSAEKQFRQSQCYHRLLHKVETGEPMADADWDELENHVALLSPNFRSKVYSLHKCSPQEYHVSLLLKAHFAPTEIATLICRSQSAVASVRSRLYQKVFGKKGSPKDWDDFIASL